MSTTFAGYKLRSLREARGYDQRQLAEHAGLSSTVISYLETGRTTRPKLATVRALARALDVQPGALFKRTHRPANPAPAAPAAAAEVEALPLFGPPPQAAAPARRPAPSLAQWAGWPVHWRSLYDSCLRQGFTAEEAIRLVCATITAHPA